MVRHTILMCTPEDDERSGEGRPSAVLMQVIQRGLVARGVEKDKITEFNEYQDLQIVSRGGKVACSKGGRVECGFRIEIDGAFEDDEGADEVVGEGGGGQQGGSTGKLRVLEDENNRLRLENEEQRGQLKEASKAHQLLNSQVKKLYDGFKLLRGKYVSDFRFGHLPRSSHRFLVCLPPSSLLPFFALLPTLTPSPPLSRSFSFNRTISRQRLESHCGSTFPKR